MNTSKRFRFSRHFAAFLMAAGAATAAVPVLAQPWGEGRGPGHEMGQGMGRHGGGMGFMGGRALDAVGATAEQRSQIEAIFKSARTDLQGQRDARQALHTQMRQLYSQPTVDARAAEQLRQQQMALHDKASQRMTQAMLEASRVLTPEQRTKLATLMAERAAKRGQHTGGR